jgi:hypothetical protein
MHDSTFAHNIAARIADANFLNRLGLDSAALAASIRNASDGGTAVDIALATLDYLTRVANSLGRAYNSTPDVPHLVPANPADFLPGHAARLRMAPGDVRVMIRRSSVIADSRRVRRLAAACHAAPVA